MALLGGIGEGAAAAVFVQLHRRCTGEPPSICLQQSVQGACQYWQERLAVRFPTVLRLYPTACPRNQCNANAFWSLHLCLCRLSFFWFTSSSKHESGKNSINQKEWSKVKEARRCQLAIALSMLCPGSVALLTRCVVPSFSFSPLRISLSLTTDGVCRVKDAANCVRGVHLVVLCYGQASPRASRSSHSPGLFPAVCLSP